MTSLSEICGNYIQNTYLNIGTKIRNKINVEKHPYLANIIAYSAAIITTTTLPVFLIAELVNLYGLASGELDPNQVVDISVFMAVVAPITSTLIGTVVGSGEGRKDKDREFF